MSKTDDCILCSIVAGTLSARKVYEDDEFIGILDATPCAEGHCLVVPKKHIDRFYDLDDDTTAHLFRVVNIVARKIKKAFSPDFVSIFIRGGRISHLHVAVFPSMQNDSLSGFPQSSMGEPEVDLDAVQAKLVDA
ncbi:MAG: HIT family protein [Dissulfurispiraceae bacterium]|jgi:histidine triad (HIT) family protein|nr:HIT family protein [Dissulfurispiraceae bacterium]